MMFAVLGYAFGKSSDIIYKRKMCIQFEIKDHASTSAVMSRQYLFSKTQCMTSCTRHLSCNAFNFSTINGTCVLLEISEICLPSNVSKDITLVKLTECQKISPWEVITPAERKLQWMEPGAVGSRHIITVSGNEILRQVARALYGGTYLPGFVKYETFFASTMEDTVIRCSQSFQVLTYEQLDDYLWMNFTLGEEVPPSAVVGGYWRDETPLYVISVKVGPAWKPGFYTAVNKRIYFRDNSRNSKQRALILLLEN